MNGAEGPIATLTTDDDEPIPYTLTLEGWLADARGLARDGRRCAPRRPGWRARRASPADRRPGDE